MKTVEQTGVEMRQMLRDSIKEGEKIATKHEEARGWIKDIKENHLGHIESDIKAIKEHLGINK